MVKKDFEKQVGDATKLFVFMVSERHCYRVPDKIIDDIEAAREVVKLNQAPTAAERALLAKAHRDLILVPDVSVTYSGVPPAEFWQGNRIWACRAACRRLQSSPGMFRR